MSHGLNRHQSCPTPQPLWRNCYVWYQAGTRRRDDLAAAPLPEVSCDLLLCVCDDIPSPEDISAITESLSQPGDSIWRGSLIPLSVKELFYYFQNFILT